MEDKRQLEIVFYKGWFKRHQKVLVWFANTRIGRYILRIHGDRSSVGKNKIFKIEPHAIHWYNNKNQCMAEYRTHAKFAKRLYYGLKPLWFTFHFYDWLIGDRELFPLANSFLRQIWMSTSTKTTPVSEIKDSVALSTKIKPISRVGRVVSRYVAKMNASRFGVWLIAVFTFCRFTLVSTYSSMQSVIANFITLPARVILAKGNESGFMRSTRIDFISNHSFSTFFNKLFRRLPKLTFPFSIAGVRAKPSLALVWKNLKLFIANNTRIVIHNVSSILLYQLSFSFATLTKYPDANPESATVDGYVLHSAFPAQSWASIRGGAGTSSNDSSANTVYARIYAEGGTPTDWFSIYRSIFLFDTSSLTSSASVIAAVMSVYGSGKWDSIGCDPALNLYSASPASNTSLTSGDYDSLGATAYAAAIAYGDFSTSGYNALTLNSTGRSAISKTSITKFGLRETHDAGNFQPGGAGVNTYSGFAGYFADQTGTSADPKLVITYGIAATPGAIMPGGNASFELETDDPACTIFNPLSHYLQIMLYVNGTLIRSEDIGQETVEHAFTLTGGEIANCYAEIPSATSCAVIIRVNSYLEAGHTTQVGGDEDLTGTMTIDQVANVPTFTTWTLANLTKSIEVRDKYDNLLITSNPLTLTGSADKAIKGYSKARATIAVADKAIALNSATMDFYRFETALQNDEADWSNVADVNIDLDNIQSNLFTVTAFDSRNLITAVQDSFSNFAEYEEISIFGLTVLRTSMVEPEVIMAFTGTWWDEFFGGGATGIENAYTCHYRYKESNYDWEERDGTFTVTIASPAVVTMATHGFETGDQVWFETTGALPTGLVADTYYYVIRIDADTFNLATSYANAVALTKINTSGSQSGVHTLHKDSMWNEISPSETAGVISFNTAVDGDQEAVGFNTEKSYTVEVRIFDKLSQVIVEGTINKGIPVIDLNVNGVAIKSKYSDVVGGSLQVDGVKFTLPEVLNKVYPVGAIYISVDSTSPATLFGGTWAAFGAGKVLVSRDSGDANFDTAEETGGTKTHTLTTAQMPAHQHSNASIYVTTPGAGTSSGSAVSGGAGAPNWYASNDGSAGGGGAHNNLQPYIVVYMWKRTA